MQPVDVGGLSVGGDAPARIAGVLGDVDEEAVAELTAAGADIVEVDPATVDLEEVIQIVDDGIFAVRTSDPDVAARALEDGVDLVHDPSGFGEPSLLDAVATADAAVVKGAAGAAPDVDAIYEHLAEEPLPERAIVDVGLGTWDAETDRQLLQRLHEFAGLARPILVSPELGIDTGSAAVAARATLAIDRGAAVIRTTDVAATRTAAELTRACTRRPFRDDELGIVELERVTQPELARHVDRIGGSRTAAGDGVIHVFALEGLERVDAALLEHLVPDCGGTFVTGDGDIHLLSATRRELRRLQAAIGEESDALAARLDGMVAAVG